MSQALSPLGGHAVFLLLIQLALLLVVARLGGELSKRIGVPAVVGELAAGILLGPSVFGHFAPHAFAMVFPHDQAQHNLLEVVGTLGMVFLLLLTGLETDVRLLRNLGRAALIASAGGMVVPFVLGFGLGMWMPEQYLANPDQRVLFSLFLATAMSISAMPVIARILMDLDLTKRNIGLVILSAGVVDDTSGWLILSVIAGVASHGDAQLVDLAWTLGFTVLFIAGAALIVFPALRWLLHVARSNFRSPDTDLVFIVVVTFLCAAATEYIGIHAVFGAFVAGVVLHQVPRLDSDAVHRLESFVFSILAPVFFGVVGLKVDLWQLGGGWMLAVVLAVACLGKLVGCTGGALAGGLRFWESMSIAVAMNARGAMELVVATIGLSLGLLNQQMFSIIVLVAVVTSLMAPLGLRLTMRMVRMTGEEARRIAAAESKGIFDPARVRLLVPTAAGPNAIEAARLAVGLARRSENPVEIMFVDARLRWWERFSWLRRRRHAGTGLDTHLERLQALAETDGRRPRVRTVASRDVADTIVEEAGKGYDMILMGASLRGSSIGGRVLECVVAKAPCHVTIVHAGRRQDVHKRLLVPVDGSVAARVAVELAARYTQMTGAELTLAMLTEMRPYAEALARRTSVMAPDNPAVSEQLERISPIFRAVDIQPTIIHLAYDPARSALRDEVKKGNYDLVVLGAENRAIQNRLYFGYENERLIRSTTAAVAIVVPSVARLK